ncbi:DUF882 domain-containing protein [Gemmata sp. G18]|uniref:DUF882 domain-containing protein n=1 Tax=Gemmata palustris TaxID=2822762 RepID=A0ABS5BX62_9BACT|nr:D-Ala-D-Ala carboxypeptidase family metallohydrolase [Gemmata palustris]MBP3958327.1 DUF882 domain-containing protein [Gemmata palustris]
MKHYYPHFRDVPAEIWRWPDFTPAEIACKGTQAIMIDFDALDRLQDARTRAGKPFIINSGYRSEQYNRRIGGAPHSMHLHGRAFDISLCSRSGRMLFTKQELLSVLKSAGFTGFGVHYNSFVHADTGTAREW